jgi:hypothetical protein
LLTSPPTFIVVKFSAFSTNHWLLQDHFFPFFPVARLWRHMSDQHSSSPISPQEPPQQQKDAEAAPDNESSRNFHRIQAVTSHAAAYTPKVCFHRFLRRNHPNGGEFDVRTVLD